MPTNVAAKPSVGPRPPKKVPTRKLFTFLNYGGNCEQAFRFYEAHLGGKITLMMTQGELPDTSQVPPERRKDILHARMNLGGTVLIGSDVPPEHFQPMRSAYLYFSVDTIAEADRIYSLLTDGGQVFMPLAETFFAFRFAMFRDKFGTSWALIFERSSEKGGRSTANLRAGRGLIFQFYEYFRIVLPTFSGGSLMPSESSGPAVSKTALWTGRVLSAVICLLLILDCVGKFMKPQPVIDSFAHLGIPIALDVPIGVVLFICTLIYAIPPTSVLGAILLTGYLGGAVMTHLRAGDPLFSHALFPSYLGVLVWLAIWLREPRLRALTPFRN